MRKALQYGGHPFDCDRLFSVCILNYGMHSALMGRGKPSILLPMSSEQRVEWMESFPEGETADEKRVAHVVRVAVSEVEAWECIERVRARKAGAA